MFVGGIIIRSPAVVVPSVVVHWVHWAHWVHRAHRVHWVHWVVHHWGLLAPAVVHWGLRPSVSAHHRRLVPAVSAHHWRLSVASVHRRLVPASVHGLLIPHLSSHAHSLTHSLTAPVTVHALQFERNKYPACSSPLVEEIDVLCITQLLPFSLLIPG